MSFLRSYQTRRNIEQWKALLAQARKELWQGNAAAAKALYEKVARQAEAEKPKNLDDPVFRYRALAALGLWGVAYLQDNSLCGEYEMHVQSITADKEVWLFIANVFSVTRDTARPALRAYTELIQRAPAEKVAQTIEAILQPAAYSFECLELYGRIDAILPFDTDRSLRLMHWHLKAMQGEKAGAAARRLLDADPNHVEAHRCLGYLAELARDWEAAARHYAAAEEWLRLAVAANNLHQPERALDVLGRSRRDERNTAAWLYHAGWASYQLKQPRQAYGHWTRLKTLYPDRAAEMDRHLLALAEQAVMSEPGLLVDGKDWPAHPLIDVYQMQAGANLLASGRRVEADALLTSIVKRQPKNAVPNIFLGLCKGGDGKDLAIDATIYGNLKKYYQNASLFLWLRGLLLVRDRPVVARQYLIKARQEGIDQFLPARALEVSSWVVEQVAGGNSPGGTGSDPLPNWPEAEEGSRITGFYQAIAAAAVLLAMQKGQLTPPALRKALATGGTLPATWKRVALAACARYGEWGLALAQLPLDGDRPLEQRYLLAGLRELLRQNDWQLAAAYAERGLSIEPGHAALVHIRRGLHGYTQEALWRQRDYAAACTQVEAGLLGDAAGRTGMHHNLALLYSQQAIQVSQGDPAGMRMADALWRKAIGHWAVALADEAYWDEWSARREAGSLAASDRELNDLRARTLPEMLWRYWSEKAEDAPASDAENYHAYRALLNQEVLAVRAMLAGLENARIRNVALPERVVRLVSPLLLKDGQDHGDIQSFLKKAPELGMRKVDVELIQQAFSPLADAMALVSDGQFQMAIRQLNDLEARYPGQSQFLAVLRSERQKAIQQYARELVRSEAWSEAMLQLDLILQNALAEARNSPEQVACRKLYTQAIVGWAQAKTGQGEYAAVVKELKAVRGKKCEENKEFKAALAEALAKWGEEALKEDDLQAARTRLDEAYNIDPNNRSATTGLGAIWARNASQEAEKQRWDTAYQYARKAYELLPALEVSQLWGAIAHDYAVQLWQRGNLVGAKDVLLPVMEIPLPNELIVAIQKVLAGLLVDQGVLLVRAGNPRAAVDIWEMALQIDPQNETARNNLRTARGY